MRTETPRAPRGSAPARRRRDWPLFGLAPLLLAAASAAASETPCITADGGSSAAGHLQALLWLHSPDLLLVDGDPSQTPATQDSTPSQTSIVTRN